MSERDAIQTVREALKPFADPFKVEPARRALDRIEAVVNAARELELRARSTSDRPTMNGLRRALSLLDSQEERTP